MNKTRFGELMPTNEKSFHFNFNSKNNLLLQQMKFQIKNISTGGYIFYGKNAQELVKIGDITLMKGSLEKQKQSHCNQSDNFEYGGISNALCGKTKFTISQLLVLQMN